MGFLERAIQMLLIATLEKPVLGYFPKSVSVFGDYENVFLLNLWQS